MTQLIKCALFFSCAILLMSGCHLSSPPMPPSISSDQPSSYVDITYATDRVESTPTNISNNIEELLPPECTTIDINAFSYFQSKYNSKVCKLSTLSQDKKYLAYITLSKKESSDGTYYVDTVKILNLPLNKEIKVVYFSSKLTYIGKVEWSRTNKLMFWESIWEGAGTTFIYDPDENSFVFKENADLVSAWIWNQQHTAFYAEYSGAYGAANCVNTISGYSFQTNAKFPDLYSTLNIKKPSSITIEDNINVQPHGWSRDGNQLWITLTHLHWKDMNKFEIGPQQVGAIMLSMEEPKYTSLAANISYDYYFEGTLSPKIKAKEYKIRYCP